LRQTSITKLAVGIHIRATLNGDPRAVYNLAAGIPLAPFTDMTHHHPRILTVAIMLGTTILTACGESAPSALPLAPSSLAAAATSPTSVERTASATFAPRPLSSITETELRDAVPVQDEPPAPPTVEIDGTLASLRGACPVLTFTVRGTRVVTSETTIFRGNLCEQLGAGSRVTVRGTPDINGTLVASHLDVTPGADDGAGDDTGDGEEGDGEEGDDEAEDGGTGEEPVAGQQRRGIVASLRGACPTLTFNLKGTTVVTNTDTTYTGGSCATLRPNVMVAVTGTDAGHRRLVAVRIEVVRAR
jgi:hypothetical protein